MSSRNENQYWRQREEEALKHYLTEEEEYQKRIDEIYADMLKEIQSEIDRFYRQYAIDEEISLAEAKKRISAADIREYERKAAQYVEDAAIDRKENGGKTHFDGYYFSEAANDEMRIYNATMKINRLEMLKANIGLHMVKGHAELETFMERILQGRTEDELKRQAGILGDTVRDNAKDAQTIVHASFHHATFSERIWASHERMKADLAKLLQTGLIRGVNARKLAGDMREYILGGAKGGARFNAERLMRTELARVQIEAQKKAFIEMGFEEYTFHANPRCCDACRMLDGKHFKIRDMMSGENAPPMHPLCKCSISAYEDRKEYEEWLDFLKKGGTTEEWENLKNKNKVLKKLSLDEFKKMKHPISKKERKIVYGKGHFSGYINSSNARKINNMIRRGEKLPAEYQKIADTLQHIIDKNVLNDDIIVTRYVYGDALEQIAGVKMPKSTLKTRGKDFWDALESVPNQIEKGHIYTEKGFLSTSGVVDKNVMSDRAVKLEIRVPKNTNCYITTNYRESEIIFGQNTRLKITGSRIENSRMAGCKVVLECIIE